MSTDTGIDGASLIADSISAMAKQYERALIHHLGRRYATVAEMPAVLSLPSGLKLPTRGLVAWPLDSDGTCEIDWAQSTCAGTEQTLDPHDAAALHAALSRFGYEADAPTLKGDDADGDGIVGERHRPPAIPDMGRDPDTGKERRPGPHDAGGDGRTGE